MKLKSHKALMKRIRVTKNKKVLKRYSGQDHFNSRDSGKITRKKRRDGTLSDTYTKTLKALIPNF